MGCRSSSLRQTSGRLDPQVHNHVGPDLETERARTKKNRTSSRASEDPATVTAPWPSEGGSEFMTSSFITGKDTEDHPSPRTMAWKLSTQELSSGRTLKHLQDIMSTGCLETGITKCRATLMNETHIWISTRNGAFSPALAVRKSPFQPNFDAFYKQKNTEPIMMEDARLNPVCANHPGVAGRPNMRFFYGGPMISRGHLLGILYLWQSEVAPKLPVEKVNKLKELANEAIETLQMDMFETLGATTTKEKAEVELPALWLDISTPRWQIVGANDNWVKLTGITMADMADCEGLLDIMAPANETALSKAVASVDLDHPRSVPAIMSPTASEGCSLQFAFAMTPYLENALPEGIASSEMATFVGGVIWKVEVHARIQSMESTYKPSSNKASRAGSLAYSLGDVSNSTWHTSANTSGGFGDSHYVGMSSKSSDKASRALSATLGPPGCLQGASDVTIPPRLATLQLGELIGKGSFGKVYFGTLNECPVAVKVMQAPPGSADVLWAAQYETMIASDLQHDNIVQTIDWCEHVDPMLGGIVWIVQELCDRGSLNVSLERGLLRGKDCKDPTKSPPDLVAYLETALDVARGMQYLHSHDVLHGDLSSNNIMLVTADTPRGFIAKINDFGLSRALGEQDVSTKTIGTVSHMCPELLLDGVNSKAGDVYSFGVALWEMWKGARAFAGCSQAQVIFAVTCSNGGGTLKIPTDAPQDIALMIKECLDSREHRPSFDDIVPKLEAMLDREVKSV